MLASLLGAIRLLIGLAPILIMIGFPGPAWAEDVATDIYRYGEREVSTGYYEEYEVKPFHLPGGPVLYRGVITVSPSASAASVRWRTYLTDSHWGLRFYAWRTCIDCHPQQARDRHTVRAGITCRQCHGPEPIAAINHYYSPMNPIRRYAYVCAKCHEGATAAFAGFYVHEPPGTELSTRESFPVLFYASWGMLVLFLGTLAFFVPHSLMVGVRELCETKGFKNLTGQWALPLLLRFRAGVRRFFEKKKTPNNEDEDAS